MLFPKKCVHCGAWEDYICSVCEKQIVFKLAQECPKCNRINIKGAYCKRCRRDKALSGVLALSYYKDPLIKELISEFKYNGVWDVAALFAEWASAKIKKEKVLFDIIAFVPLSKKRLAKRGYNQSELLAEVLGQKLKKPVIKGLKRIRETKTQVGLTKKERLSNLSQAFAFEGGEVMGKKILLVDDVLTTGSTLNECAGALKRVGAKQVWGLVIAKE